MPLPDDPALGWPPEAWDDIYKRYVEHAAWFSGDPGKLTAVYAGGIAAGRYWRTTFDRFWARGVSAPQRRLMIHVPMAADLATVNSDMLFSEPPDITIPPDSTDAAIVQDRLNDLVTRDGIIRTCSEAAETVSALGGGFLRVTWNKDLEPEHPLLTPVDADSAIPEFHWTGRLMAVTFWNKLPGSDEKETWRVLERHEAGYILTGLYMGDEQKLGVKTPMGSRPEMAMVEEVVETGIEGLTAVYIPNVRPNRTFRGSPLGRSDYDGIEAIFDALDETYTDWQRALRMSRPRLIVPEELVKKSGPKGTGGFFDMDQEVWESVPVPPTGSLRDMITPTEFKIETDKYAATARAHMERIVAAAGYSGATFDLEPAGGRPVSTTATEIVNRERRSFVTRGRKANYWTKPLEEILEAYLAIDAQFFESHEVTRPRVEFSDSFRDDPQQVATVAGLLRTSKAASADTLVRMVHPKWTDAEVGTEVKKILEENSAAKASPAIVTGNGTGPAGQFSNQPTAIAAVEMP